MIEKGISLVMYGIHKCSGSCLYCSAASTMNYNEDGNKNTFKFDKEKIIYEEGKFYVISKFLKADEHIGYDADVIQIGYELYKDELWPKYKEHLLNKNNKTIEKIKDIPSMQDKVLALKKLNERIENYGKN